MPPQPRCCKVITTCFVPRVTRERTTTIGNPAGFFNHSQNFPSEEAVLDLVKLNVEIEQRTDPGVPVDTIIVNNDTGWQPGNSYLEKIKNTPTRTGRFFVLSRRNFGRSFGGYHAAFETLAPHYDYWLFTEDDILVNRDSYYSHLIGRFASDPDAGFVSVQGLSTAGLDVETDVLHAHGGVGLTHHSVLEAVRERHGYLPHCRESDPQDYHSIIRFGEIAFTNLISKLGYRLLEPHADPALYVYAYDYMRRISVPAGYTDDISPEPE